MAFPAVLFAVFYIVFGDISKANDTQNFVLISKRRLDITKVPSILIKRRVVVSELSCAHWCLRASMCLSFNLEKDTESNKNRRNCELLSVDEKLKPHLVEENSNFDLYSIQDPCNFMSCLNNGACVKSSTWMYCVCKDGYEGTHCEIISECVHYKNLSETDRNVNYGVVSKTWDGKAVITTGNWYRFTGPAGSRMLDTCPSSPKGCNADFNGWIDKQPNPGEVRVERQVQKQSGNNCYRYPQTILATNCGDFNVYRLKSLNKYVRYCGTD